MSSLGAAAEEQDPNDAARALGASGALRSWCDAGVLHAADVHVASLLGTLVPSEDQVLLAAALAVRALRLGSVCVDLATVAQLAGAEGAEGAQPQPASPPRLECPEPAAWLAALRASALVAVEGAGDGTASGGGHDGGGVVRPLRLAGSLVYLDRYWNDEELIAEDLRRRARARPPVEVAALEAGVRRLFADRAAAGTGEVDYQAVAAACGALGGLTVVSGGPGTGKTTTVARLLALLHGESRAQSARPPLVALCAPTGKAAARMRQAVQNEAARLAGEGRCDEQERAWLHGLSSSTLHRLLGTLPSTSARFRHHRRNRLPHDVVVVDEASMVPLALMARLLEAVRADARVVLVGDHEQLASVEAGSVLGDIVGPAGAGLRLGRERLAALAQITGSAPPVDSAAGPSAVGDSVVVLRRVHRFGGAIAELALAVQRGDAEAAMSVLRRGDEAVRLIDVDPLPSALARLDDVAALAVAAGRELLAASSLGAGAGDGGGGGEADGGRGAGGGGEGAGGGGGEGDGGRGAGEGADPAGAPRPAATLERRGRSALEALGRFRLLCANRRGPYGVTAWQQVVEAWMRAGVPGFAARETRLAGRRWYPGLPLLVVANDYELGLFNGDAGVVVEDGEDRLAAVFESAGPATRYGLDRLGEVERCFATTVHKSQGSQFGSVAVVLPAGDSPILTRELLYTAVTRASEQVIVVGEERSVRAAVSRPIARASGLRAKLWLEQ